MADTTDRPALDAAARGEAERKIKKAQGVVSALCLPRGTPDAREWVMSIPARPDYDPDLVIGDGLQAGAEAVAEVRRLREELSHANREVNEMCNAWRELAEEAEREHAGSVRSRLRHAFESEPEQRETAIRDMILNDPAVHALYSYGKQDGYKQARGEYESDLAAARADAAEWQRSNALAVDDLRACAEQLQAARQRIAELEGEVERLRGVPDPAACMFSNCSIRGECVYPQYCTTRRTPAAREGDQ